MSEVSTEWLDVADDVGHWEKVTFSDRMTFT